MDSSIDPFEMPRRRHSPIREVASSSTTRGDSKCKSGVFMACMFKIMLENNNNHI